MTAKTTPFTIPKLPKMSEFQLSWDWQSGFWRCVITPDCPGPEASGTGGAPRSAVNGALRDLKIKEKEGCYE